MTDLKYDVVVVGGGVSGLASAVASKRSGSSVLIVERTNTIGGSPIQALVNPFQTFHSPRGRVIGGFAQELVERLQSKGGSPGHIPDPIGFVETITPVDSEMLKLELSSILEEAKIEILLEFQPTSLIFHPKSSVQSPKPKYQRAKPKSQKRISAIKIQQGSKTYTIRARVFIDATGNADLSKLAGERVEIDPNPQPMSLLFKVGGVDLSQVKGYILENRDEFVTSSKEGVLEGDYVAVSGFFSLVKRGVESGEWTIPRDRLLFFQTTYPDEILVNTSRIFGNPLDPREAASILFEGRRQVDLIWRFMKRYLPGFGSSRITQIAERVGVRETRRIIGRYLLNEGEIQGSAAFSDVIAKGAYPIDVHLPYSDKLYTMPISSKGFYDIPLRSLLSKGLNNLITVGKCISVTHLGFSSTRVIPTAMAIGQAGGTAASILASTSPRDPEEIVPELQARLLEAGAILNDSQIRL